MRYLFLTHSLDIESYRLSNCSSLLYDSPVGVTLSIQVFFIALVAVLVATGVNVIPFSVGRFPLEINKDVDYLRGLAWSQKNEDDHNHATIIERLEGSEGLVEAERTKFGDALGLIFQDEENVFTQENFRKMKEIEDEFRTLESYREKYCSLEMNEMDEWTCSLPSSVLRY